MLNNTNFSNRLKKVMEYYNISASIFAETIEVPRSSISHILSGRNKPSLEFVLKTIETYQEVDLYWLLKGIGQFPKSTSTPTSKPKELAAKKTRQQITPTEQKELFSDHTSTPNTEKKQETPLVSNTSAEGKIEKIMIFYRDGTFKEYSKR